MAILRSKTKEELIDIIRNQMFRIKQLEKELKPVRARLMKNKSMRNLMSEPESKAKQKEYSQRPEVKDWYKGYWKEYYQRPEVKERARLRYLASKNKSMINKGSENIIGLMP